VIAIVAFIFARKAFNQTAALRARLDLMETVASSAAAARPMPPPLPAQEAPIAPSAADQIRIETTEEESPPRGQPVAPPPMPDIPAAAPASQPGPGFEERIGTRWVVWVGGLTLALGGFFMVRYSIDAGLLGPGVRTLLGGAFALALLASANGPAARRASPRSKRCRSPTSPRFSPPPGRQSLSRPSTPPTRFTVFSCP